ncbi:glycosyltransferase [Actinomarinicola tropica]|uniref:glycosyltransferase n=1 Tax=Actinomarinicola tropica TaxID=2789776 RepID=UPI0018997911|nr:glycosyltransferase [Actinomarinicola tropica]
MSRAPWEPPLVSVVIPTFNRSEHLPETLDSILIQDHPALEVVVVDDGSTDATPDVLARYAAVHPEVVRAVRQDNAGQSAAVNHGLSVASGELLTLVSDDDPLLPGAVSRLVQPFLDDPDLVAAYPDWRRIDPDGATEAVIRPLDYRFEDMVRLSICIPGPCTLFRRALVDLTGGWDPTWRFVPDFDFWLRAGLHGPMRRVPEVLATWRNHPGATSNARNRTRLAHEHVEVIERFFARDDLPASIRALEAEALHHAHATAALVLTPARPGRFEIRDRTAPLVATTHPPAAPADDDVAWLHGEIRRRDRELAALRATNHILEQRIDTMQRMLDSGVRP